MTGFDLTNVTRTEYPAVRRIMGGQRHRLDDADLESLLESRFPEADPADVEDFMRGLQSFAKQAAPLARRALPATLKGAAMGASVGGPYGALIGAVGGAGSMAGPGYPPARPVPRSAPTTGVPTQPPVAPGATRAAAAVEPATSSSSTARTASEPAAAAAQLLALLSRLETMQALLALVMAGAGKSAVVVGSRAVPAAAFAEAIAELAGEALTEFVAPRHEQLAEYLLDDQGQPRADILNPRERAALLFADLAETALQEQDDNRSHGSRLDPRRALQSDSLTDLVDASDPAGDPIDGYEAALEGRNRYDY